MSRRRSSLRDESGISTAIVAVSLVGIFAGALLSLDAGNMWQTRRNVITATDATALDMARWASYTNPGAGTCDMLRAGAIYSANAGADSTLLSCTVVPGSIAGSGYVVVQGNKLARSRFGGLFHLGNTNPFSLSAAQYGYAKALRGLEPIGLCSQNVHYQAFRNGTIGTAPDDQHVPYSGAVNPVHRITYNKEDPTACGSTVPGNWGWQDYDGGNNSTDILIDRIIDGYQGEVGTNDCDNDGATEGGEVGDGCFGDTGAGAGNPQACNDNTVAGALNCIMSDSTHVRDPIYIVIFDSAVCTQGGNNGQAGGGNNCTFHIIDFLGVRLWGFDISGAESTRYFDLEFIHSTGSGVCCSETETSTKVVYVCDVDHDVTGLTAAQRCS